MNATIGLRPWQQDLIKKAYAESNFRKTRQKINQLVEDESWTNELKGDFYFCLYMN